MSWDDELADAERRRTFARAHGGPEKVARHTAQGKMVVRERIAALADSGSFDEVGGLTGFADYDSDGNLVGLTPANIVCGRATIGGRDVFISGDDFTVRGGANDGGSREKFQFAEHYARAWRVPFIRLVDGTGGGGSVKHLETLGRTYLPDVPQMTEILDALSEVPVVALGLGSVAGMGAARVTASHYSVMVRGTSQLFAAGPPVVARVGETLTKDELGGAHVHIPNGTVDDAVDSEAEAFERARRFLSYLPQSVHQLAERVAARDDKDRTDEALRRVIPRDPRAVYKMRPILESVLDSGSFFEMGRGWGRSVITGLARLDGWPVAILASDPYHYGGAWTADACRKAIRLVDLAETFHLPVVHFVDIPGFLIGKAAEASGVMRYGAQALTAIRQSRTPWCAVMVRKAYGMAGLTQRNASAQFTRFAWPSAEWGSLPIAGGVEAAYRAEIAAAADPAQRRADIEARLQRVQSPLRTAEVFGIEDIIDPAETRRHLTRFAHRAAPLRTLGRPSFGYRP